MMVLAGVTINIVINGGLIGYAQDAKNKTAKAKQDEEEALLLAEYEMSVAAGKTQVTSLREYKLEKLGLHIGDYVNYSPDTVASAYNPDGENSEPGELTGYIIKEEITDENGDPVLDEDDNPTYAYSSQSIRQDTLNWRILGYDETKDEILLISGAPTEEYLYIYGHTGYQNYKKVLNETCRNLYSNEELSAVARSITMNDIDVYLGGNAFNKQEFNGGSSEEWGFGYKENLTNIYHPEIEDWTEEYDENDEPIWKGTWSGEIESIAFSYNISNVIKDEKKESILIGTKKDDLVPNKTWMYQYWVADTGVNVGDENALWDAFKVFRGTVGANVGLWKGASNVFLIGQVLCYSSGSESGGGLQVRPVVSIPYNIFKEQIRIIEEQEERWTENVGGMLL